MFIFLDIETTGIDIDDKICSCGILYNDVEMHELFNDGKNMTSKASSINNITDEMLRDKCSFLDSDIYKFLEKYNDKDRTLVIHDAKFVLGMFELYGISFAYKIIDTKRVIHHLVDDCDSYNLNFLRYDLKLYRREEKEFLYKALSDAYIVKLLFEYIVEMVELEDIYDFSFKDILLKKFNFGKYKDRYIEEIVMIDREYIDWLLSLDSLDSDLRFSLGYYI